MLSFLGLMLMLLSKGELFPSETARYFTGTILVMYCDIDSDSGYGQLSDPDVSAFCCPKEQQLKIIINTF